MGHSDMTRCFHKNYRGEPRANHLFSRSMKGKISNFLHEVEKEISVISM